MYQQPQSSSFKTLQIIHIALCTGAALFFAVVLFLRSNMQPTDTSAGDNSVLSYIAIGFAVGMVLLSQFLFKTLLSRIDLSSPVKSRFTNYVSAFIVRAALVEGSTLFNIVVVMLSGSYLNMGVAVVLLLILIALRPQKAKVMEDLKISYPDVLD